MARPRQFSDVSELKQTLVRRLPDTLAQLKDSLSDISASVRARASRTAVAGSIALLSFFLLDFLGLIAAIVLGLAVVWLLIEGYQFITIYQAYTKRFDAEVYRMIFRVFELEATQTKIEKEAFIAELNDSELITETVHTHTVDDRVTTEYDGYALSVTELHATRTEGSGKNKRTVTVFKGVFVTHELPKTVEGETYISTEGDKHGFGHQSFWKKLTGRQDVEVTELEWNEFEKDLHVVTSNPTEARYILTPDFMHELHDWWRGSTRNIRISFKGNRCYVLFPDSKISFGTAPLWITAERVENYAMTIATPLWHVFNLLDDVRTRFRV